jgi:hypothetical protein
LGAEEYEKNDEPIETGCEKTIRNAEGASKWRVSDRFTSFLQQWAAQMFKGSDLISTHIQHHDATQG